MNLTADPNAANGWRIWLAPWTPARVTLTQAAALLPVVFVAMIQPGAAQVPVLAVALVVTLFWEMLFAVIRRRPATWHGITTALILAVMVPGTVPLWQIGLAASFGVVLGELVFGGRGFGFVSAAAVSMAFLVFSFPGSPLIAGSDAMAAATLPGAALLLVTGLVNWRVIVAVVAGLALTVLARGGVPEPGVMAATLAFGLVFVICDPVATAVTQAGRWVCGALVGVLLALFSTGLTGAVTPDAVVFAALLGSIFAPLIDHLAVLAMAARRRHRHG